MTFIERVVPGELSSRRELAAHVQRYKFAAPLVQAKRVLDAGCGSGYGAKLLRDAGASGVVGVDISHEAIEIAHKRYSEDGVQFLQDDCQSLSQVSGTFDVIVAFESIEHFEHPRMFLERVRGLLAPGGILIGSTPNGGPEGSNKPQNPHHVQEYGTEQFLSLLQDYFPNVQILGQQWTSTFRTATVIWSNPMVRFGRFLQRLRGRNLDDFANGQLVPTEGDLVISDINIDLAAFLLCVCRCQ